LEKKEKNNSETLKILLVIPTFNNRPSLAGVVQKALQQPYPVLVVNDGSTDGAMNTLPEHPRLDTIGWMDNRGKGAALIMAVRWAIENQYTHMVTMDADGQHDPLDAEILIRAVKNNPQSLVIGDRISPHQDMPLSSRFGRKFSNFWVWVCTGQKLSDTQSGFRAYPLTLFKKIEFTSKYYNFEIEVLVKAIWAGLDVTTADVSVSYDEQSQKASHFHSFLDNARISVMFAKLVFRNFFPFPHKTYFQSEQVNSKKLSVKKPKKSLKILFTEATSVGEIALACMLGVFLGTLPLVAVHSIVIVFVATRLRLNRLIALNISHFCAPPFVPVIAFEIGYYLLNGELFWAVSFQSVVKELHLRFVEYALGATVLAPVLALFTGSVVFLAARILHWIKAIRKH